MMKRLFVAHKKQIALGLIFVAATIFIFAIIPWLFLHPVPCIHKSITGIGCPLCGMTHALYETFHLRFLAALRLNPAVMVLILWLGAEAIYFIDPGESTVKLKKIAVIILLISLGIVYIFRLLHILN